MGRKPNAIFKGKLSKAYYILYKRVDLQNKRRLIIRLLLKGKVAESAVLFHDENIRVEERHFNNEAGRLLGGYDSTTVNQINILLRKVGDRAIEIGDRVIKNQERYSSEQFRRELFGLLGDEKDLGTDREVMETIAFTQKIPVEKIDDYTGEVLGHDYKDETELVHVTKHDIEIFNQKKANGGYAIDEGFWIENEKGQMVDKDAPHIVVYDSKEDFYRNLLIEEVKERQENEYQESVKSMPPEKRFKDEWAWYRGNIFNLFGYVRYGVKKDAAGNEVPLIPDDFKQHMKKLLSYRVNASPKEAVRFLNEDWVHGFYKWLKETGHDPSVHKLSHNPFIVDPKYIITDKTKLKPYGLNTFGEAIHKHMVKYIKVLYDQKLIKEDFSGRIDAQAFAKSSTNKKGNLSNYNENIDFLEPSEFLKLMFAELSINTVGDQVAEIIEERWKEKTSVRNLSKAQRQKLLKEEIGKVISELNDTRDGFILAVLLGGLRISDLIQTEKSITNLTSFSLIEFSQRKTGGYVKNLIIEPALRLLKKHDNKIPVTNDVVFNRNLKILFKLIDIDRKVSWNEMTLSGTTRKTEKLSDIISSKFARSTYYVLCGVMREPIDSVIKRTGHSDRAVALKHYYAVGSLYTEDDLIKLFEIFGKNRKLLLD